MNSWLVGQVCQNPACIRVLLRKYKDYMYHKLWRQWHTSLHYLGFLGTKNIQLGEGIVLSLSSWTFPDLSGFSFTSRWAGQGAGAWSATMAPQAVEASTWLWRSLWRWVTASPGVLGGKGIGAWVLESNKLPLASPVVLGTPCSHLWEHPGKNWGEFEELRNPKLQMRWQLQKYGLNC